MEPELLQSSSPGSFGWFSLICLRGGASTAAVVRLHTVTDKSRKKMTDGVTRSPARLGRRDGKICYYGSPEYDFLAFVPCFQFFVFSPSLSRYVYLLSVLSSVQQSFATLSK